MFRIHQQTRQLLHVLRPTFSSLHQKLPCGGALGCHESHKIRPSRKVTDGERQRASVRLLTVQLLARHVAQHQLALPQHALRQQQRYMLPCWIGLYREGDSRAVAPFYRPSLLEQRPIRHILRGHKGARVLEGRIISLKVFGQTGCIVT